MDNQLTSNEVQHLIKQIALVSVAFLLVSLLAITGLRQLQVTDPYIKTVLSLNGDRIQGKAIFLINCAGCHATPKNDLMRSQIGPNLHRVSQRKSKIGLIEQVTSGKTPPMPQFQPNPQEMADLLSYLKEL
ncbi:cytochrome C [Oscillatoriales cyanobacterium USR001]|nr:cytochrome C [Oscillatoriales cyanobacterium USR001]